MQLRAILRYRWECYSNEIKISNFNPGSENESGFFLPHFISSPLEESAKMKRKKVIRHIVSWLTNYSKQSQTNGFVVGISGGIDSALTSTLCALTGKKVIALNMPILQHKEQDERAKTHIAWLEKKYINVTEDEIDLTDVFLKIQSHFPNEVTSHHLTMANTRSRLRMLTLYAYAGGHRMLVAGTGNKVEDFGVGFFTKYGDGGVDLSPIADLMKSEVYALAKELGVDESILAAPPTDGLWQDKRTDEEQIGASYNELEWAMNYLKRKERPEPSPRQKQVIEIYQRFNSMNAHKMKPIPVCIIPKELK